MMLRKKLPALNDVEGNTIPDFGMGVIDAHVHVFPERLFKSIWQWFDKHGWPIRYRMRSSAIFDFLLSRGIAHIVALQYAHKPGIARELNRYMADLVAQYPGQVTGMATIFPGEANAADILTEAFDAGLKGVKLHAHVQCFDMNSQAMGIIYDLCAARMKPMVMHVGREPKSPAYACDPHLICHSEKLEAVIKNYPGLKICVPHLGVDEFAPYQQLIQKYDNLWLDTAVVLTDYLPNNQPIPLTEMRPDRIMYGSDFPNIPFAWDRELKWIFNAGFPSDMMRRLVYKNAVDFFSIPE